MNIVPDDYFEEIVPITEADKLEFRVQMRTGRTWHIVAFSALITMPAFAWWCYNTYYGSRSPNNFVGAMGLIALIVLGTIWLVYLGLLLTGIHLVRKTSKCRQKRFITAMVRAANEYTEFNGQIVEKTWFVSIGQQTYKIHDVSPIWPKRLQRGEWVQMSITVESNQLMKVERIADPRLTA